MSVGADGILDTSTLILLNQIRDPGALPQRAAITAITLAELSVGPLLATDDPERAARQSHLQQAEQDFDPIPFDAAAARAFGRVGADLRAAGRKHTARAFDALIAATAIATGLPLHTVNPNNFRHITELDVRPVPHPERAM